MAQERPPPPEALKPWYYQYWFLYPVIVFWPVWPVLIIRSPWHNGLVSGAVAWAMLIVGTYLIGYQQLWQQRELNNFTITLLVPGVILTVVTQALWLRDKGDVRRARDLIETVQENAEAAGWNAIGPGGEIPNETPGPRRTPPRRTRRRNRSRNRRRG